MITESLVDMARARRSRVDGMLIGLVIAVIVVWITISLRIQANMADIQRLEQLALAVARIDTDIAHIKRATIRLELLNEQQVEKLLRIESELKYRPDLKAPNISPAIEGLLRQHLSASLALRR